MLMPARPDAPPIGAPATPSARPSAPAAPDLPANKRFLRPSPATATAAPGARMIGEGVPFDRIRRITGYLVGTLDRFNNAKRAEYGDRVRHGLAAKT